MILQTCGFLFQTLLFSFSSLIINTHKHILYIECVCLLFLIKFVCQAQSCTHIYAASFGTKHMWGYFYGIDSLVHICWKK